MNRLFRDIVVAGAMTLAAMAATVGTAHAAYDSYTVDHVELDVYNYDGQGVSICNWQSSSNTFWFWVKDDTTNDYPPLNGSPISGLKYKVSIYPSECLDFSVDAAYGHTLQAFFETNGVTYGTNPVPFG